MHQRMLHVKIVGGQCTLHKQADNKLEHVPDATSDMLP